MKQTLHILRGRPWLVLLALLAWLLPQRVAADTYVDKSQNYTVSLGGSNVVYFSAAVYDMDGADCWVEKGYPEMYSGRRVRDGRPDMGVNGERR